MREKWGNTSAEKGEEKVPGKMHERMPQREGERIRVDMKGKDFVERRGLGD
jgi:hypothetical protein